MRAVFWIS